jgi:hypothetical protein
MYLKLPATYPYSLADLHRDHPHTCFPDTPSLELLAAYEVYPVAQTAPPAIDAATQGLAETLPILVDDQWTQQWAVRDLTTEEIAERTPKSVTALQGLRAIHAAGLVPAFLAWKATLDPVDDFEAIAFLEKAQTWVYDDPVLNAALAQLNMTTQKAALFTLASTL